MREIQSPSITKTIRSLFPAANVGISENARSRKQFFRDLQRAALHLGYDDALDVLSVQLGQRTTLTVEIRESRI